MSWVLLRGRCRRCSAPISVRYPLLEALTGLLFVACLERFGLTTQALAAEWACRTSKNGGLEVKVHNLPHSIEEEVAALKIAAMGVKIDRLTPDQKKYLSSWTVGT